MFQARGLLLAFHIYVAIAGLALGASANAGRVESRWVQSKDPGPLEGVVAGAEASPDGDDDYYHGSIPHDVRLLHRQFQGSLETSILFAGGNQLFPALRISGARGLKSIRLMHHRHKVHLDWVANEQMEATTIARLAADGISYHNRRVYLYDRAYDGTWNRRELLKLELHFVPVGHHLGQSLAAGAIALTTAIAQPASTASWLALTGLSAATAAGTCAMWLLGGWQADVSFGLPEPCDAP